MPTHDHEEMHSLPVPEEVKTDSIITAIQRQEEEDSRAAFKKTRRRSLILMGVAVVAFVAVVGFMVAFFTQGERTEKSVARATDQGRQSDVDPSAWDRVIQLLKTYTPEEQLHTSGTPQNEAANWMTRQVTNNGLDVPSSASYDDAFGFVQRYVLATFYIALDGDNWKYKLSFLDVEKSVCDWNERLNVVPGTFAMVPANDGEEETGGYQGDFSKEILATIGVRCNDLNEVEYIYLPDNNLNGEIPPETGLLEAMRHFSVYSNSIGGTLPSSLMEWNDLEVMIVEHNQLTGNFPPYISQWSNLLTISFANNKFRGDLPSFEALTQLKSVALNGNNFTGPIDVFNQNTQLDILFLQDNEFSGEFNPTLLSNVELQVMDCSNNKITGELTSDWYSVRILDVHNNLLSGNLPEVDDDAETVYLSLYGNGLTGEIPESIGNLYDLYHLDLSNNKFTGAIPATLNMLTSLEYLYLGNNNFDPQVFPYLGECGDLQELSLRSCNLIHPMPHFIGRLLRQLVLLDVSNNRLEGEIRENLAHASDMRFLLLANNNFTGSVPEEFVYLESLSVFTVDHNPLLSGSMGDICDQDVGPQELQHVLTDCSVDCPCCDVCCTEQDTGCGSETVTPNLGGDGTYERVSYIFNEELVFSIDNTEEDGDD